MAHKRAFSKTIIETDAFQDMSQTAQLLYFYLNINADDDGFVGNPKRIMRAGGFAEDDFKVLLAKRFLIEFENGVVVIKHWLIHNTIRKDRYCETTYLKEKKMLQIKENKAYTESWQPNGNRLATQDKIREDKIREDNIILHSEQGSQVNDLMKKFISINPSLKWQNRTERKACEEMIERFGYEKAEEMAELVVQVQGQEFAPRATTPTQMWRKIADFKYYFEGKNKSRLEVHDV